MLSSFIGVRKGLFVFGAHFHGERKVATNTGRLSADLESTNRSTKETRRTKLRHVPARFERSNKWSSNCFGKTHAYCWGKFKKKFISVNLAAGGAFGANGTKASFSRRRCASTVVVCCTKHANEYTG